MKVTKSKIKQFVLNVPVFLLFFFTCFILVLNQAVVAQVPILEYKFNEVGTTAYSTGSNATTLTIRTAAGVVEDFHSADCGGVTGASGDRALDNTSASYMGSNDGYKANQADLDAIDTFMSFTLCGWFKTAGTEQIKYACLFENGTSSGFNLYGDASGTLKLKVDGDGATSIASYTDTLAWVFFAKTYDGTDADTSVVKFYKGTKTQPVAQVGPDSYDITFRGQVI